MNAPNIGAEVDTYRIFHGWTGPFKVMAVADGYAMVRRPSCMPTVVAVKDCRPHDGIERIGAPRA